MRGFRFQLKKELRAGLNPDSQPQRNSGALTESMNLRCTKEGLEGYNPRIAPVPPYDDGSALVTRNIVWPFPQLFIGPTYMWIGHRGGVDAAYWDGTKWIGGLFITPTPPGVPVGNRWPWTYVELPGWFVCLCSGDLLWFYIPDPGGGMGFSVQYEVNSGVFDVTGEWDPAGTGLWGNPLSVCLFRGQLFLAGNRAYDPLGGSSDNECRSVRWSSIGEFKFLGTRDGLGTYDYRVIPDAGQLFVPGHREVRVYRMLALRDHVVAYCSNSVVVMTPVATPTPAFKVTTLAPVGVSSVYSPAGNEDYHVFVDRIGNLWMLENNLKLTKLGYEDIFQEMQGHRPHYTGLGSGIPTYSAWNEDPLQSYNAGDIVISPFDGLTWICLVYHVSFTAPDKSWMPGDEVHPPYTYGGSTYTVVWEAYSPIAAGDGYEYARNMIHNVYNPVEDEFYISNGVRSFLLSADKMLTEISRCVTSLVDVRGTFVEYYQTIDSHTIGFWKDTGDRWSYFATDIQNMNNNMIKTIETVELDGDIPDDAVAEISIYWRIDRRSPWRQTDWTRINPKGVGTPMVSGVEFKVCVRVRPFDGFHVSAIGIGWKQSDRSQIRGAYAVANEASANSSQ